MGKLNTKLNMSNARHPRTDGLIERVNQNLQTLLRCYCAKSGSSWTSHLSIVEFYYNCSINESTSHSPFEVMYGFQPSTPGDRFVPLTGASIEATDRMTMITDIRDVVHQLTKCQRSEWRPDRLGLLHFFNREIMSISQPKV